MLKKDKTLILAQPKLGFLYSLKAPVRVLGVSDTAKGFVGVVGAVQSYRTV